MLSDSVADVLNLTASALATSGDYRNYFEIDGKHYSHTIDPRTGYPVQHNLASVTVLADSSAAADAWATAFMVLGTEKSLVLANKHQLSSLLISRESKAYTAHTAANFEQYTP
jgi:thiamine biosynthesis lipoprotein